MAANDKCTEAKQNFVAAVAIVLVLQDGWVLQKQRGGGVQGNTSIAKKHEIEQHNEE